MTGKARIGLILLLAALLLLFPIQAMAATVDDVASQLICQCGCTALLTNCTHGECHVRDTMTTAIKQGLEQGKSPEQLVKIFVAQYGEQVLASPPKRGFNLMAWILPFVAIALGGWVIYFSVKKWVFQGREAEMVTEVLELGESDEYGDRVEKELTDYSERSFR
ncbi:MAG: cytochrome c-type biogenesis protein CcmH [Dehalococcoidales bacterium]|nr:cytochrome c-type biogenesis protein CcmH [Dehalococcoidales bacterium]